MSGAGSTVSSAGSTMSGAGSTVSGAGSPLSCTGGSVSGDFPRYKVFSHFFFVQTGYPLFSRTSHARSSAGFLPAHMPGEKYTAAEFLPPPMMLLYYPACQKTTGGRRRLDPDFSSPDCTPPAFLTALRLLSRPRLQPARPDDIMKGERMYDCPADP